MAWQALTSAHYENGNFEWSPTPVMVNAVLDAIANSRTYANVSGVSSPGSYPMGFYLTPTSGMAYSGWPTSERSAGDYTVKTYQPSSNTQQVELPAIMFNGSVTRGYAFSQYSQCVKHTDFNPDLFKGLTDAVYSASFDVHVSGNSFNYLNIFSLGTKSVTGYTSEYDSDDGKYKIYYPEPSDFAGTFYVYNDDLQEAYAVNFYLYDRDNSAYYMSIATGDSTDRYAIMIAGHVGPPPVPEDWESIDSLSSGEGESTSLTVIKKESINNGDAVNNGSSADLDRAMITGHAAISTLVGSSPAGTVIEKALMSGYNYMNINVLTHTDPYDFTARLDYFMSDGTPIYSHIYQRTAPEDLSIAAIRKVGENKAKPTMVYMNTGGGAIVKYNQENDIDDATYELLYSWLIGSGGGAPDPYEDDNVDGENQIGGTLFTPQYNEGTTNIDTYSPPDDYDIGIGFFTAYRVTTGNLTNLAATLWNPDFFETIKSIFRTPAEAIVGIMRLPIDQPLDLEDTDPRKWYSSTSENICLGPTEIKPSETTPPHETVGQRVIRRFVKVELGTCEISSKYDTYMDYAGYKKIEINLPFIGQFDLDVNELMCPCNKGTEKKVDILTDRVGCTLKLVYWFDTLTGTCVAQLAVDGEIRYQWAGMAGYELPWAWATRDTILKLIGSIVGIGTNSQGANSNIAKGAGALTAMGPAGVGVMIGVAGLGVKAAQALYSVKNSHSNGSFSSLPGAMEDNYPYIHITYQKVVHTENQEHFLGNGAPYVCKVGDQKGFCSFKAVHLDGIPCTDDERVEIASILREGVIV